MVGLLLLGLVESSVEKAKDTMDETSTLQPRLELMTETDEMGLGTLAGLNDDRLEEVNQATCDHGGRWEAWDVLGLLLLGLVESSVEKAKDIMDMTSTLQPRLELMTETDEVNTVFLSVCLSGWTVNFLRKN